MLVLFIKKFFRLSLILLGIFFSQTAFTAPYKIGVYYYPGWSPFVKGTHEPDPWAVIKAFPEREPQLGWYNSNDQAVIDKQLGAMLTSGIKFVIFDWYWENAKAVSETSVSKYLQSPFRKQIQYALLWANHTKEPRTLAEWDALVDFWLANHLLNPEYLTINGKPVMFLFSGETISDQAQKMGMSPAQLLDRARQKAKNAGLPGIYFVLCVQAVEHWVKDFAPRAGFDALTAYNYHFGVSGNAEKRTRVSHSFAELDQNYQQQWDWIIRNSPLPYMPPMTSGWDKRPWGRSGDPLHDNSVSTPASFEKHLTAGKALMDAFPTKTLNMGVICCWNEYGEGSYIEPTKLYGTQYLSKIRNVFFKVK